MHFLVTLSNLPLVPLQLPVFEDLLPPHVFLLHSPQLVFILLLLLHHFSLLQLLLPLVLDRLDLVRSQALEVVRLHSVGSEHRHSGVPVFCHEVIGQCVS